MKRQLLVVVFLASFAAAGFPSLVHASEPPARISLDYAWPAGHEDTLRFTKKVGTRKQGRGSVIVYAGFIDAKVIDSAPGAARLTWTYRDITRDGQPFLDDLSLQLAVGRSGSAIENLDDVVRKVTARVESLGAQPSAEEHRLSRDQLRAFAANPALMESFYLQDFDMFALPLGQAYDKQGAMLVEGSIPSPFPEYPLTIIDEWTVVPEQDTPAGRFALVWKQRFDPQRAGAFADRLKQALGVAGDGKPVKLEVSSQGTYELDALSHWPVEVLAVRFTTMHDVEGMTAWEFESED